MPGVLNGHLNRPKDSMDVHQPTWLIKEIDESYFRRLDFNRLSTDDIEHPDLVNDREDDVISSDDNRSHCHIWPTLTKAFFSIVPTWSTFILNYQLGQDSLSNWFLTRFSNLAFLWSLIDTQPFLSRDLWVLPDPDPTRDPTGSGISTNIGPRVGSGSSINISTGSESTLSLELRPGSSWESIEASRLKLKICSPPVSWLLRYGESPLANSQWTRHVFRRDLFI